MKTVFEHIEHIKGKPHHIRKRVAFGLATGATALIALAWFVGSFSTGTFALGNSSFADAVAQSSLETSGTKAPTASGIAGVAAALDTSAPAHIEIVDTASSTKPAKQAEQTTIPF